MIKSFSFDTILAKYYGTEEAKRIQANKPNGIKEASK